MPSLTITQPAQFLTVIPQILADLGSENLLLLQGPLGAGKTTFTQYLGKYLQIAQPIVSPTFTYIRDYTLANGKHFYHLDMYRFAGELEEILWPELRQDAQLVVVEWPDRVPEIYNVPHLAIDFSYHEEQGSRLIKW